MGRTASKARTRWPLTCGSRCPWPDCHLLPSTGICWHLLLCGRPDAWDTGQLTAVRALRPILAIQHLTCDTAPGTLHDIDGQAFARLGVERTAHYLIRPDGHVGYRAAGTDLHGLQHYLTHLLPHATPHPA